MRTISDITKEYAGRIDYLDLELIFAHSLGKTREFVLAHPEYGIPGSKIRRLRSKIARRTKGEPVAYIMGHKEFYGLDFSVDKNTLIPRPETELLVEKVLELRPKNKVIIDIGSGSGNIIISLAKNIRTKNIFFAIDISPKALAAARRNAKRHRVDGKIKFLSGNLLDPLPKAAKLIHENLIIVANLPYLSAEIYQAAPADVKKYEPKSALYSAEAGLAHYRRLLAQIKRFKSTNKIAGITVFLEISPEQKKPLVKMIPERLSLCENLLPKRPRRKMAGL